MGPPASGSQPRLLQFGTIAHPRRHPGSRQLHQYPTQRSYTDVGVQPESEAGLSYQAEGFTLNSSSGPRSNPHFSTLATSYPNPNSNYSRESFLGPQMNASPEPPLNLGLNTASAPTSHPSVNASPTLMRGSESAPASESTTEIGTPSSTASNFGLQGINFDPNAPLDDIDFSEFFNL